MKFISGINKAQANPGVNIKIPIYHRTSISFFNGVEVYYIYRTYTSNNYNIGELILTPIKPEIWHHVRKVTLNAIDGPGIINAITTALRDLKINVNIEEAITTQIGAIYTITLIIDISIYIHNHAQKYNVGDKVPKTAIEEIEEVLKKLVNPYTLQPIVVDGQVSIRELTFLESISNIPQNFEVSNISDVQFHNCANQKIKNENGEIKLNKKIVSGLKLNEDMFYYTMLSDTEEKYIKVLFFDPNQTVAFIDILHEDIYGAIAKFTEIIHNDYQYNILASYSHQQMQKDIAHWYALIDVSNKKQEFFTETLDALKTAKYGETNDRKNTLEVFLIEANTENIPNDTVRRFGQNRKTKDGETTAVYLKKQQLILQSLNEFGISTYIKTRKAFITQYNLHNTTSMHNLIHKLISDKRKKTKTRLASIGRWLIAFLIPVSLLAISMAIFPRINKGVHDLLEHAEDVMIGASAIALLFVSHKMLEKYHLKLKGTKGTPQP